MANTREDTDGQGTTAPLVRLLGQVERRVSRQLEATLAEERLTVDQWRVLDLLSEGPGRTMSYIAAATGVPGPTLTKIVDRLIDAAAVYRLVDPRDRRRVLAFISDDGRLLHDRLAPRVTRTEADALSALGEDAPTMIRLLVRLAADR
ncbi:MAG TPA: MarR family transcriptional regulator [Actinophytocola sp.]|nr:MarR family transcriptional regulator [Actinophytocola sp.]